MEMFSVDCSPASLCFFIYQPDYDFREVEQSGNPVWLIPFHSAKMKNPCDVLFLLYLNNREMYREFVSDRKEMLRVSDIDKVTLDDESEQPLTPQFSFAELAVKILRDYAGFPSHLDSAAVMRYHSRMLGITDGLTICLRMQPGSAIGPYKFLDNG